MATVAHLVTTADSGAVPNTSGSFTPTDGDLLVVFVTSANSDDLTGVSLTSSVGTTFYEAGICLFHSTNGSAVYAYVAESKSFATSQTVTFDQTTDPADGTVISVLGVAGMSKTGSDAVLQYAEAENGSSGGTPSVTFGSNVNTSNPTLLQLGARVNPPAVTEPTGWTEHSDTGFDSPSAGAETISRDSGFTGTTVTWGSTVSGNFGVAALELDASALGSGITIGAEQGAGDQVASGESVSITVPSGTTVLLVGSAFWGAATAASVSDWTSGTEVFTQIVFNNGSGLGGDMAGAAWALANPTAKTNTITVTVTGGSNHQSVMAIAISGTADGSTTLTDAVQLGDQVNNEAETSTLAFASSGLSEEALLAFVWWLGDDQEGITNNAGFLQLLEGATSAGADGPGNSDNTYHCAWLQDGAPKAVTFTSGASADENIGFYFRLKPAPVGTASFIGGATGESSSSSTVSVTHGLTILEDDVIVAVVNENFISAGATHSDNNGANSFTGAFQEDHPDVVGADSHYSIWTRVAGASEPSSYSFSSSSTNNSGKQVVVYQLRGIDTSNIWDVAPSASTRNFVTQASASTTATTPTAINGGAGNIGLAIFTSDGTATFSNYSQAFTDEIEDATPTRSIAVVSREYTTTGSKAGPQATLSSSDDHVSHHLILNAAPPVTVVITDVANSGETPGSGTETWQDGSTGNVITGTGFM